MSAEAVHRALVDGGLTLAVLAAAALMVWNAVRAARRAPREAAAWALLGGVALAWRLSWPAGPADVNPRSMEVLVGLGPDFGYGRLVAVWWRTFLPPGARTMIALFHGQAVVGALTVVALGAWLRAAGAGRMAAGSAALLLALDPVHARWSHTDAPGILAGFLLVVGLAGLADHLSRAERPEGLLAVVAVGLATMVRPEMAAIPVLVAVWAVCQGGTPPWRDRVVLGAGLAMGALVVAHVVGVALPHLGGPPGRAGLAWPPAPLVHGARHYLVWDPVWYDPRVAVLVFVGVVAAPGRSWRRVVWTVLALGLGSLVLDPSWSPFEARTPSLVRHQLVALPAFFALAAFGIDGLVRLAMRLDLFEERMVVAAYASLVALATFGLVRADTAAWRPYTAHAEHAFARRALPQVPDGCTILTYEASSDAGLAIPMDLTVGRGPDLWRSLATPVVGPDAYDDRPDCLYWYRGANCEAIEARAEVPPRACDEFEAMWPLEVVEEVQVPAEPFLTERYADDTVRLGLYRVVR